MEDLLVSLITQQEQARPRTGEELETFGKHAANLYLRGECKSLTGAVVQAVKTAGLAPEQVRRVVEFANTSAYLEKFASGTNHKVINFAGGPASYPEVLRDLNDGGSPAPQPAPSYDYQLPPPDVNKLASANMNRLGVMDPKLAQAFAAEEHAIPYADPLRDVLDAKDKLAGLYHEATSELSGLEAHYLDVCDRFFGEVKQASLGGVSLGQLLPLLQLGGDEPEFFKAAFAMLTPRLVDNGVFPSERAMAESIEKTASAGLPNPHHPLVGIFADYCDTLSKLAATRQVQDQVAAELDKIETYLKKAAGVASGLREAASLVPKAWGVARDVAAKASVPVGEFVGDLAGENAGALAGAAVKYAPHIAVGLGAEEAYQRARANPFLNGLGTFVASRVPYTQANMIRQYQLRGMM